MHRIISGIASIFAGISATLYGILPHFLQMENNRSILANAPSGPGPVYLPAMVAIPPISYPLIIFGSVLIGLGIYLIFTGIWRRNAGILQRKYVN